MSNISMIFLHCAMWFFFMDMVATLASIGITGYVILAIGATAGCVAVAAKLHHVLKRGAS